MKSTRVDLRVETYLYSEGTLVAFLVQCRNDYAGYTLAPSTVQYLQEHARCAGCGGQIVDLLAHSGCPRQYWLPQAIEAVIADAYCREARLLIQRERGRRAHFKRKLLITGRGESHTRHQIQELFALQEGRCYYCFTSLVSPEGEPSFHRDHFAPLIEGGDDSIHNIVLTCPSCNIAKRSEHGTTFRSSMLRRLSVEVRAELRRIHQRLAQHAG